ncbi:CHAT domain-containing protein [Shewanella algae]|uniref:CHAT domain-containing protein n=1 Tax=Shewanella algae TaxID=38313 RepID=UPI0027180241|nr:CHAT domain-containing protein [Shewanella algae]MDO8254831.1 CHAT domain-containing protein [Shewanella algae]
MESVTITTPIIYNKNSIIHILISPNASGIIDYSPFQGFNNSILNQEFILNTCLISRLPTSVDEILMDPEELVDYRNHSSSSSTVILNYDAFRLTVPYIKNHPFITISTSNIEASSIIDSIIGKFKFKPILIGFDRHCDIINTKDTNIFCLDDIFYKRLKKIYKNTSIGRKIKRKRKKQLIKKEQIYTHNHNVTLPNESLLLSLGYDVLDDGTTLVKSANKSDYIDAMINSSNIVNSAVKTNRSSFKSDIVIFSPSFYTYLYNFKSNFYNELFRLEKDKAARKFIFDFLIKNREYSGIGISKDTLKTFSNVIESDLFRELVSIRAPELKLTAASIAFLTTFNNCPAVRLPNGINFHHDVMNEIESLALSPRNNYQFKMNKKYNLMCNLLKDEIGDEIANFISENSKSVMLCTDAPIEWVKIKDIPLMISHEVSKIHVTPGNQFFVNCVSNQGLVFNKSDLLKVTIIRSFEDSDPLKDHLVKAVSHFANLDKNNKVEYIIIDVKTKNELISAISNNRANILIFDCHGNHGGEDSNGWLQIGKERVNTWELPNIISPIVILSACLTSALSGSHASVANGLLAKGAVSVLGTLLPVDADKAAILVGRILYRIAAFLPAVRVLGRKTITWRNFLTGFLRMSFFTDVLTHIRDNYNLSKDTYILAHNMCNNIINTYTDDWYEQIITNLSEIIKLEKDDLKKIISNVGLVETLKYSQLGRPELIMITLEDR